MHVRQEIRVSVGGAGPGRVLRKNLPPQLVGDAQPLEWAETRDALAPIGVLARARGTPISVRKIANRASDHDGIVDRPKDARSTSSSARGASALLASSARSSTAPRRDSQRPRPVGVRPGTACRQASPRRGRTNRTREPAVLYQSFRIEAEEFPVANRRRWLRQRQSSSFAGQHSRPRP